MKNQNRAIILRLPESMIERLDAVVFDLQMPSRSSYILRSLNRALEFSEQNELSLLNYSVLRSELSR